MLRSDDGGFSWAAEPELAIGDAIDFVDGRVGWVAGSTGAGGELRHTTDGGRTWRSEAADLGASPPFFFDVDAVDHRRAVIAGSDGVLYDPDPHRGPPAIFFTHDAGATWQRAELRGLDLPLLDEIVMTSICVTEAGHGLAFGADFTSFTSSVLLVTHDAGATWDTLRSAPSTSLSVKVDCADERDFWIADASNGLFHSADAGATWHDPSGTLPDRSSILALDFDGGSEGRVVTFANRTLVLLHTIDGGEHWTSHAIPGSTGLIEVYAGLDFHGDHGVVVLQDLHPLALPRSSFGVAFATSDGGATWTETVFPEPVNALWDVALLP